MLQMRYWACLWAPGFTLCHCHPHPHPLPEAPQAAWLLLQSLLLAGPAGSGPVLSVASLIPAAVGPKQLRGLPLLPHIFSSCPQKPSESNESWRYRKSTPGRLSSDQETANPLLFPPFLPSLHLLSESPLFWGFFTDNVVTKKLAVFSYEAVRST